MSNLDASVAFHDGNNPYFTPRKSLGTSFLSHVFA